MKLVAIILVFLLSKVVGMDVTPIKATASRIDGKGNEFGIRIEYETRYVAKLDVDKGRILKQRIVRFYDGAKHVGTYYLWDGDGVGGNLPVWTSSQDLLAKPAKFTEVRITDRFYDVNWRDGRWTEKELGAWFTQTWHLFNSCNRNMAGTGYFLCEIEDVPRMDGYLNGAGFTVYAVLEHSFILQNKAAHPEANQYSSGKPASLSEHESTGSHKHRPKSKGHSR